MKVCENAAWKSTILCPLKIQVSGGGQSTFDVDEDGRTLGVKSLSGAGDRGME